MADGAVPETKAEFSQPVGGPGSAIHSSFPHLLVSLANRVLPSPLKRRLRAIYCRLTCWPPVGRVRFGSLRRVTPVSRVFGFDRGQCIDRYYIETFLARYATDIHGCVLEVGDNVYTRRFGDERVIQSDVLHVTNDNPQASIVADLACADRIPPETFDCIILTQTLHLIYDVRVATRTLYRILKPGGVLLATFPGISQISRYDMERWGDHWRFTTASTHKLFADAFPKDNFQVESHGNVLVAAAYLYGLAAEELDRRELDYTDPDYQLLITVRAEKPKKPTR